MLKDWLSEMRIKSLLLAFTNCDLGCGLGFYYGEVYYNKMITDLLNVYKEMI